jgi:hypothetical protein
MQDLDEQLYSIIPSIFIECYPWDINKYSPKTEVKITYSDIEFNIKFICFEKNVQAKYLSTNDPVYKDSCVEFFFNPLPEKTPRYINFEINAAGAYLLQVGEEKEVRQYINDIDKSTFNIRNYIETDFWSVEFSIPFSFIEKYYGKIDFKSGYKMKANFYKCGDDTAYPHYGCWSEIVNDVPNFHLSRFFGELVLE